MRALVLGGVVALCSVAAVLAAGQVAPPAGDYQIDSETTTTVRSGPMVMKSVQRVDGASGATTVEQTGPDGSVSQQSYPGQGRNHWCVKGPSAPPPGVVSNCKTQSFQALQGGGSTYQTACSGGQVISDNFRKLADGRWERTFETRQGAVMAAPVDPRTSAAMAPVIAQIEEAIRSGPPAEREAAKEQLAALKASLGGGGASGNDTVVSTREVWTKVSERCG